MVGPADERAKELAAYQSVGVHRVMLWPVQDEFHQLETFREQIEPLAHSASA